MDAFYTKLRATDAVVRRITEFGAPQLLPRWTTLHEKCRSRASTRNKIAHGSVHKFAWRHEDQEFRDIFFAPVSWMRVVSRPKMPAAAEEDIVEEIDPIYGDDPRHPDRIDALDLLKRAEEYRDTTRHLWGFHTELAKVTRC
jgi:hypothetical protein